jgi:hypothetical protein
MPITRKPRSARSTRVPRRARAPRKPRMIRLISELKAILRAPDMYPAKRAKAGEYADAANTGVIPDHFTAIDVRIVDWLQGGEYPGTL